MTCVGRGGLKDYNLTAVGTIANQQLAQVDQGPIHPGLENLQGWGSFFGKWKDGSPCVKNFCVILLPPTPRTPVSFSSLPLQVILPYQFKVLHIYSKQAV